MQCAVAFVLPIGCVNVASLMLHGVRLAAIGLAFGLAGALAVTRLMTTLRYGVRPTDPMVFASMAVALMAVAVAASVVPSLRIARIRPANALRYEGGLDRSRPNLGALELPTTWIFT